MSKHKSNVPQKPQNQANFTKKAEITDNSTFKIADSKSWIWGLVAAALGFILYFNTFSHDYCLDDFASIKDNIIVKGGIKNIGAIFTSEYRAGAWNAPGSLYRPFSLAMFAWEWQFSPFYCMLSRGGCFF
jgi:protein O-mannosyl-transferase